MSWAFLQGEMTSFVIFFSSCLVFIISLSLFNIIWGRKTFSKSPSSSWEVIWGNQRRPLSLFHIPFANADRDHHPARWEAKARLWQQFFHNERFQRMANDRQGEWKLYTDNSNFCWELRAHWQFTVGICLLNKYFFCFFVGHNNFAFLVI